jgi:two-component system, LytTR family, response regulator LytT
MAQQPALNNCRMLIGYILEKFMSELPQFVQAPTRSGGTPVSRNANPHHRGRLNWQMGALPQVDGKRSMTVELSAMIRAVVITEESLSAQQMASLVDDTRQVKVIGIATDGLEGLRLCNQLLPEAVFLDTNVSGHEGVSLATQLTMLAQPPRLVFSAGNTEHAVEAFRLKAVDYLLKPLDPLEVVEAVDRLLVRLRPLEFRSLLGSASRPDTILTPGKSGFPKTAHGLLPVKGTDRDQIQLLARHEVVAVVSRQRRTWIHTVRQEFATRHSLVELMGWLRGSPFIKLSRQVVVNLRAVERVECCGVRAYRVRLRDRLGTEIAVSRTGTAQLAAALKIGLLSRRSIPMGLLTLFTDTPKLLFGTP